MTSRLRSGLLFIMAAVSAACGDPAGPTPGDGVEPIAGDWEAAAFVVTSIGNPERTADLIDIGSVFQFSVQPSGRYQASLTVLGSTATEFGSARLQGSQLTLFREFPTPDTTTGTVQLISPDRFDLTSDLEFTFVDAEGPEPSSFTATLDRASAGGS